MLSVLDDFGRHVCTSVSCNFVGLRLVGRDLDTLLKRLHHYKSFWDAVTESDLVEFRREHPFHVWLEAGKTLEEWNEATLAVQRTSIGAIVLPDRVSFQDEFTSVHVEFFDWHDSFFQTQLKIYSCEDDWETNIGWGTFSEVLVNVMIDPAGEGEAITLSMVNHANRQIDFDLHTIHSPVDRYIAALKILGYKSPQIHKLCEDAFGDRFSYAKTYIRDKLTKMRKDYPELKEI